MRRADILACPPLTWGMSLNTALKWICQKVPKEETKTSVGKKTTTAHSYCRMSEEQTRVMHHPRNRDSSARASGRQHSTLVTIWAKMLRNETGSYAEFVKERNWGDFKRQVWQVVVNIQNTSALLQCTRWDTLLIPHPHPSEPKEVYQYLDALEVGRFELHVPVSGDLKESNKQGVKHHNCELSSCSYSTENGTQWPSRHPEG